MNILQKLVGFKPPKQPEKETIVDEVQPLAHIVFTILDKDNIHFGCFWNTDDPVIASRLGELLYHINNGDLYYNIITTLKQQCKQDDNQYKFINKILKKWHNLKNKYDNQPVISPMEVFKIRDVHPHEETEGEE